MWVTTSPSGVVGVCGGLTHGSGAGAPQPWASRHSPSGATDGVVTGVAREAKRESPGDEVLE
jgi:hypothetical protein